VAIIESTPVVAVINMNIEIVDMLRMALSDAGFRTVGKTIPELEHGDQSLLAFLDEHNPQVVIYDVSPPFSRSSRRARPWPQTRRSKWTAATRSSGTTR